MCVTCLGCLIFTHTFAKHNDQEHPLMYFYFQQLEKQYSPSKWVRRMSVGIVVDNHVDTLTASEPIYLLIPSLNHSKIIVEILRCSSLADPKGRQGPLPGPNPFIFMQFSEKIVSTPTLGVGAPLGKSWIRHCSETNAGLITDYGSHTFCTI